MSPTTNSRSGARKLILNAGLLAFARFITVICRGAYVLVAARELGADAYAALSVALAWTLSFLPLATLGLGPYLIAELSHGKADSRRVLSQTRSLTAAATILACIAAAGIALAFEPDPGIKALILLCAIALIGRAAVRWTDEVFVAYERPDYTLRQEAIFRVSEVTATIAVLLAGGDAVTVATVGAAIWLLQAAAGLRLVRQRVVQHPIDWDFSAIGILLATTAPILITQLCTQALHHYPIVLARHLLDDKDAIGNIALAMQAILIVVMAPGALTLVVLPALVRSSTRRDGRDIAFMESMFRFTPVVTAGLVIAAAAIGPSFVPLLLRQDYQLAGRLLWLPVLLAGPLTLYLSAGSWLFARKRYSYAAASSFIAVIVLTLSALALIPALGPVGVFVTMTLAYLAGMTARLVPFLKANPSAISGQSRAASLSAIAAMGSYGVWSYAGWPILPGCILALALLTGATLLWGLRPEERALLLAGLPRALRV